MSDSYFPTVKIRRREMVDAVRSEIRPLAMSVGFQFDRRPKEERPWRWRPGALMRRRDDYVDEFYVEWAKYGWPRFMIEFWTSQAERMRMAHRYRPWDGLEDLARIYPKKRGGLASYLGEPWYGIEPTMELTMRAAKARLVDLDTFLKTGLPTTHLEWRVMRSKRPGGR